MIAQRYRSDTIRLPSAVASEPSAAGQDQPTLDRLPELSDR